jgi:hypothetical protein
MNRSHQLWKENRKFSRTIAKFFWQETLQSGPMFWQQCKSLGGGQMLRIEKVTVTYFAADCSGPSGFSRKR